MMKPRSGIVARLYQGHRESLRPNCCLLCRILACPADDDRARQVFAQTGICLACHDALDAWVSQGDTPGDVVAAAQPDPPDLRPWQPSLTAA